MYTVKGSALLKRVFNVQRKTHKMVILHFSKLVKSKLVTIFQVEFNLFEYSEMHIL